MTDSRSSEGYVSFVAHNVGRSSLEGKYLDGQVGTGTVTFTNPEDTPILYVLFYYDDTNDEFREVIVAKKNEGITVPFPCATLGGVTSSASQPSSPRDVESAAKLWLDISSNYGLDRWWVKSTDLNQVSQFEDLSQGSYSFRMRVKATQDGITIAAFDIWTFQVSSTRMDSFIQVVHPSGSGPEISSDNTTFEEVANPSSSLDDFATAELGESFERWELEETTKKYSPFESYPTSW